MSDMDDRGFWATVATYAAFGAIAAAGIDTLVRARRPRDLVDGVLVAVNASLDSERSLVNARLNSELFTFFAPAVAAAGVVLAIQVARAISNLEQ